MYDELNVAVLARGGYVVQAVRHSRGEYSPFIAAFSSKADLLTWLGINLASRSPNLTGEEAVADVPRQTASDDEIPF